MTLSFGQRQTLVLLAGLAALVGAAGITQAHVFHDASNLKYLLTVAGPLFVGVVVISENPLALVAGALVVAAPFAGFSMTFKAIHIPLLAPLIVGGVLIASFSEPHRARRSALSTAAPILVLALIIPIAESPDRTGVLADLASLLAAAYLASRVASTWAGFLGLVWAFVGSAVIQAMLAIWESKTGHRLNLYGVAGAQTLNSGDFFAYLNAPRPPGAFYDPISLGNMLAIAVPLSTGLVVHNGRERQWLPAAGALAALGVIIVALEITLSRMSWVGASAGLLVAVLLLPRLQRRALLPGLALALVIAALSGAFSGPSITVQRLTSITHPLNESGTGNGDVIRVDIWQQAIAVAEHHPVAGVGLGRLQNVLAGQFVAAGTGSHAHSTYLQLAAEGGAIAIAGLIAVVLALQRDLVRVWRANRLWGAFLAGSMLALLVCWITDVTIRYSGVATVMGVLFGLVAGRSRDARSAELSP